MQVLLYVSVPAGEISPSLSSTTMCFKCSSVDSSMTGSPFVALQLPLLRAFEVLELASLFFGAMYIGMQ